MSNSTVEPKQKKKIFDSTWLRTYKGFEDCSAKDAERIVERLQELANIVCGHVQKGSINEDSV